MLSGKPVDTEFKTIGNFYGLSTVINFSLNNLFKTTGLLTIYTSFLRVVIHRVFWQIQSVNNRVLHALHSTNNYNNNLIKYITNNGGCL